MKKSMLFVVLAVVLCTCILFACTPDQQPVEYAVSIDKSTTSVNVGASITLKVTKSPDDAQVVWTSSNDKIATVKNGVVTGVAEGKATITATIAEKEISDSVEITVSQNYSVAIADKTVNSLFVGKTLNLTATHAPASASVTWSSSDEKIATVNNGVVTAVKDGKVTITASVKDGVEDSIEIIVKAYSVAIADKSLNSLYITKTLTLTANVQTDGEVVWSSDNEEVATVSDGIITAVKPGKATISVKVKDDVTDSIEIAVKDVIANASVNASKFDFSGIYSDEPVIKSNGVQNSFAVFNGTASKYYVASAMVKLTDPADSDTWSRVGISHYNGTNSYYGFQLSPGVNFNARKTIAMVITDGNVGWGTITDRSQVWGFHGLSDINFNAVKLTAVRCGTEYYAYINDVLFYYENGIDGFDSIDTLPVLNLGSCSAEYSQISVSYGQENVESFLQKADKTKFYYTGSDVIIGTDGSIKFTGAAESTCNTNAKDHAAKSIGTMALLNADVQSTIEFDLKIDAFGTRDALPALAVTINRYDSSASQARSLVIGQYKAGWTGWDSNGSLNSGIGSGGKEYMLNGESTRLEEGETYHVVFTRIMDANDGQDTSLKITDKNGNVLLEDAHGWYDGYKGRVVVNFLCRDLDCKISNLAISSQDSAVAIRNKNANSVDVGKTLNFSVAKIPASATVTWASSNEDIATVENGVVTGVAEGTVTITASIGENVLDTITINVKQDYSVSISNKDKNSLYVGEQLSLTATTVPTTATVAWASSNEEIATVENGVVKALKAGTTTITATVKGGVKDSLEITVKNYSVAIGDKSKTSIYVDEKLTLTATKDPASATITWSTSNSSVATVENGVVTGVAEGKATITATVAEGISDSIEITVEQGYSVAIDDKSVNKIFVGETLTLTATKLPTSATVTWTSSNEDIATVENGVVMGVAEGKATITATVAEGVSDSIEITITQNYSIAIDNKSVSTLFVGKTLTLTATKVPTSATTTWTSSNEDVATVDNGVVTALKAGTTTIKASVKDGVEDSIEITVKAYSVAIADKSVDSLFVTKSLALTVNAQTDGAIVWTSDNEEVASVDSGVVTANKAGTATITVKVSDGVTDSIKITVKDVIANASVNASNFDFSGIYSDEPVIKSNGMQNSFAVLNGTASKYYVASAMVKLTDPADSDTWSRVGISHYNGTNSYYGFQLSPGVNFNARKTIAMVITDGNVGWGTITDRSQVWGFHGLSDINFNAVKLTAVRCGTEYYAYINDVLFYYENGIDGFDSIDTLPVLNLGSCSAEYSQISVSYGQENVESFLQKADKTKFYYTGSDVIIGTDGSIKFTGAAESTCNTNAKDHAAKSIGTMALLNADVQSTIEFDLKIDAFGTRDALPALAVTINRYDSSASQARSLVIGQYKAGWTGWDSNGSLNSGIGSGGKEYMLNGESTRLEEGETYHVVFTRIMDANDGQDTSLKITDKNGNVLLEDAHGWYDGYKGRAVVNFLCRDMDCTISNIVITNA